MVNDLVWVIMIIKQVLITIFKFDHGMIHIVVKMMTISFKFWIKKHFQWEQCKIVNIQTIDE
jgi:hypothetical protein